jgi:hypothetical protein
LQQAKQTITSATVAATSQPQERQSTKPCPIAITVNQKQSTEQSADSLVQEQFTERKKQAEPHPLQTSHKLQQSQPPPEWEVLLRRLWLS